MLGVYELIPEIKLPRFIHLMEKLREEAATWLCSWVSNSYVIFPRIFVGGAPFPDFPDLPIFAFRKGFGKNRPYGGLKQNGIGNKR